MGGEGRYRNRWLRPVVAGLIALLLLLLLLLSLDYATADDVVAVVAIAVLVGAMLA